MFENKNENKLTLFVFILPSIISVASLILLYLDFSPTGHTLTDFLIAFVLFGSIFGAIIIGWYSVSTNPIETSSTDNYQQAETYPKAFQISVSKDTPWSPTQTLGFIRSLVSRFSGGLELSIVASNRSIVWQVVPFPLDNYSDKDQEGLTNLVLTYFPNATVKSVPLKDISSKLYRKYHVFDSNFQFEYQQAKLVHTLHRSDDPLTSIVLALGNMQVGEQICYSIIIQPNNKLSEEQIFNILTIPAKEVTPRKITPPPLTTKNLGSSLIGWAIGTTGRWFYDEYKLQTQRAYRFSEQDTQRYLAKLSQPLFIVSLYMAMDTPNKRRLSILDDAIHSAFSLSTGEEITITQGHSSKAFQINSLDDWLKYHPINFVEPILNKKQITSEITKPYYFLLTSEELATLWHLPHESMNIAEIEWANQIPSELANETSPDRIIIGSSGKQTVSIVPRDLRYHASITGQTGTGKSNLLHNLTHQFAKSEQGFAVLDPHGDLIKQILVTLSMAGKTDKVLLLDLNNGEYPIPLNPFRVADGVEQKSAFNLSLWIMKTVFKSSWSETQMETVIRNALELVLTDPEATPLDIQRVLTNNNYRMKQLNKALKTGLLSVSTEMWWEDEFNKGTDHQRREKSRSVLNRLRTFLDAGVEPMACHPRGIDFRKFIEDGYIILVNLHGDRVKSEVGSLGAMLFAQLFLNSVSLGSYPSHLPPRFYLVIDETHQFITTQLDDMFSEARKFGLSLIMADQWLGQIDPDTRRAIINNRGTAISFAASEEEAPMMAKLYEPNVTTHEIINQSVGDAVIRTRYKGSILPAFKVTTLPPLISKSRKQEKTQVIWDIAWQQTIKELDLMPIDDVRQWIRDRYRSKSKQSENIEDTDSAPVTDIDYGDENEPLASDIDYGNGEE